MLSVLGFQELLTKESLALLLKPANDDVAANMTETVLELVYGEMKEYPGSEGCVAQLFVQKVEDAIKEKEEAEAAQRAEQGEEEEGPPPSEEGEGQEFYLRIPDLQIFREKRNNLHLGSP